MKRKYLWIAALIIVLIAAAIPLALLAQSRIDHNPPEVPRPPRSAPGEDNIPHPDGKPLTPTPRPDQIDDLPRMTPPDRPKAEVIDTAPNEPREAKYEIVIQRGRTGEKIWILVPVGIEAQEVLGEYLDSVAGDTYYVNPPAHGIPLQELTEPPSIDAE